ncbi:MAG TPA: amidohydrolase family protein [Microthrixaceae bacterium]|nr:amidohydrolase family protein [Microthrixaceae bacterium]HMT23852.1 amidohydrolase family protein [Microthrixaceae bacterium]
MTQRYTIISSDCHAGANHATYREYLDPAFHQRFDDWRGRYKNPFRDLQDDTRSRNWDNERRTRELADDGIVGEVVFPNTVPPFFPTGVVIAPAPTTHDDYVLRLAGIRAHNRWLSDFVAALPGRRVGLGQLLLNDIDEAIADVRWMADHGIGGVLLPGVAPNTGIEPLYSPAYDPLWATCVDLSMTVTHHGGGSGMPDFGAYPASTVMYMLEAPFFANRVFWHLTMSGVFDRFPDLVFIMTEQGAGWLPETLQRMDSMHEALAAGKFGELGPSGTALRSRPSEYFASNCYIGASFPSPAEASVIRQVGVDRFMWGSDYPHREGTYPYTVESLRRSFDGWSVDELRSLLGATAASVYGFDQAACDAAAQLAGPTVDEVAVPLHEVPADAHSPAFTRA